MKYDFSTYILNKLNEAGEEKKEPIKYNTSGENKSVEITKDSTPQDVKEWIDDNFTKIKANKDGTFEFNGEQGKYKVINNNPNIKLSDLYKKVKENKNSDHTTIFKEDDFKTLGKTIAYRSALTVWSMINTSGDDFKQAAMDVFDDNSEYSIKQLENLDSLLDLSAALQTINTKLKRNDKNDKDYDKNEKIYKNYQEQLQSKDNYTAIQNIKKNYEKEFKDHRDVLEKAFNEGMAEQKKKMQEKDYKWEDPATGKPPKGAEKLNQLGDKAYKTLESGIEKADEFAKKQQGMDKLLLTMAVAGVKGMMFGAKTLKKLLNGVFKHTNIKGAMRNTEKFNDVKKKIDIFKKEYDEWKKNGGGSNNKDDKDKTDEQKKQEEDSKKTILKKLSELMNLHVIPYYYCKLSFVVACVENIEGKYIIKQEENKWSTMNSSTGRVTIIEDNAILIKKLLNYIDTNLKDVFTTFGKESSADAFNSAPPDMKFKKEYLDNFLQWVDRIKEVHTEKQLPFKKEKLKNLDKIYNEATIKTKFNTYEEFLTYIHTVLNYTKQCDIPVAYKLKFTFDGDEDAKVPGVVTGAKKEEEKQEEDNKEEQENYQNILNSVEEIKKANNAEEVAKNYNDTKEKIDKAVEQTEQSADKEKLEKIHNMFKNDIQSLDTLSKMMYLNAAKNQGIFKESYAFNYVMDMLLEDEFSNLDNPIEDSYGDTEDKDKPKENNDYKEIFNKIIELLNGEANEENVKKFNELNSKLKDALKDKITDKDIKTKLGDDPLAIYSYLNKQTEENKDKQNLEQAKQSITNVGKELNAVANANEQDYDKILEKIKKDIEDNKSIVNGFATDEEKKKIANVLGDINSQIIPVSWAMNKLIQNKLAKIQGEQYTKVNLLLNLLTEQDIPEEEKDNGIVEKVDTIINKINDLIKTDKTEEFKTNYTNWVKAINEVIKTLMEKYKEKLETIKGKDPLEQICFIGKMLKEQPEQKKEGESTEDTTKNGEKDQETKSS